MTRNRLGGRRTADKLAILHEYVEFYTTALVAQTATHPRDSSFPQWARAWSFSEIFSFRC